jgi:hypothetical protein
VKAKAWIKRRAKELGKEGELPEGWDCSESTKTEKALEDELEKARSGTYANNAQNKKQARVGERYGSAVHGGQTHEVNEEGKLSEDDLKEHAKNASEQALANAIKTSPDPTVRQVAHAEMKRRQSEEKTGAGDSFPGKQSEGEKKDILPNQKENKRDEDDASEYRKTKEYTDSKNAHQKDLDEHNDKKKKQDEEDKYLVETKAGHVDLRWDKSYHKKDFDKLTKEDHKKLSEAHAKAEKETDDASQKGHHADMKDWHKKETEKKDDSYKKIKELRPLLQHFEEKYGKDWINKLTKEEEEYHGKIVDKDFGEFDKYINSKHRETVGKKIEKSIQGIRYF